MFAGTMCEQRCAPKYMRVLICVYTILMKMFMFSIRSDFCLTPLDKDNCEKNEDPKNAIFYDATTCTCYVFSTYCIKAESTNMFDTFEECRTACPVTEESCGVRTAIPKRPRRSWFIEQIFGI